MKLRPIAKRFQTTANQIYCLGDKAEYTGKTFNVAGKTFYEVTMLEGHMKGQLKVVSEPPNGEV